MPELDGFIVQDHRCIYEQLFLNVFDTRYATLSKDTDLAIFRKLKSNGLISLAHTIGANNDEPVIPWGNPPPKPVLSFPTGPLLPVSADNYVELLFIH
jgi:hypothetical protein